MSKPDQRDLIIHATERMSDLRARLTAARARGGVELHVALDDVQLLVSFAGAALAGYSARLKLEGESNP